MFWVAPILSGEVDRHLLRTCKIPLCQLDRDMLITSIGTGELCRKELAAMLQLTGVVPPPPVRITCLGVWLNRTLLHVASTMNSSVVGVTSVQGVPPQVAILSSIFGFIVMLKIGRVWLLNNFCFKSPLLASVTFLFFLSLVWVTVFRSLAGSSFASFHLLSLIRNIQRCWLSTNLTFLSDFPIYLASNLNRIAFVFSLCVLYVWLKVPAVALWASNYSSAVTLCIVSQIFSLVNGALLQ